MAPVAASITTVIAAHVAAGHVGQERRRRGRPAGPGVGEQDQPDEHEPPRPPEPAEAGERRLAGGERVALDLQVEEPLEDDAEDHAPEEDQSDLRGDERPEHELARGEADAGGDETGADQSPGPLGRRRQVADLGRGMVRRRKAEPREWRHRVSDRTAASPATAAHSAAPAAPLRARRGRGRARRSRR